MLIVGRCTLYTYNIKSRDHQDVDDVRLASLLSAFERDRQHRTATAAAASTPSPPLTRAPVNLKYLAFGKGLGWEEDDQAMCEWLAQEAARADSGLAGLEVGIDLRLVSDCSFACTDLVFGQT